MPKFAIHNLNTPPVEIDDDGTYTLNGRDRIKTGAPLFEADTLEAAEAWRQERLGK